MTVMPYTRFQSSCYIHIFSSPGLRYLAINCHPEADAPLPDASEHQQSPDAASGLWGHSLHFLSDPRHFVISPHHKDDE